MRLAAEQQRARLYLHRDTEQPVSACFLSFQCLQTLGLILVLLSVDLLVLFVVVAGYDARTK
jgi:hypothetical protein